MAYLIDTDWAVDYLKGVDEKVSFLQSTEDLYITTISLGELMEGIEGSEKKEDRLKGLENFLASLTVVSFTEEMAYTFGEIRNELREKGKLPGDIDLMIAATALYLDLELLTDNKKHFEHIHGIKLYD
ncbi:MAG: type II toxin-antitoxin system VapC family toxin [Thermoplasmata archaeon]